MEEGALGEDLAFAEEAFDFGGGSFGAVGGVTDVAHLGVAGLVAEVATDGSGGSCGGVGGSDEVADLVDDVFASEGEGDDGGLLHEAAHFGEEGHVRDVGVVLGEDFVGKGHHFDAFDLEAGGFVAGEDGSDIAFRDGVGLEEDECGFLCHVEAGGNAKKVGWQGCFPREGARGVGAGGDLLGFSSIAPQIFADGTQI